MEGIVTVLKPPGMTSSNAVYDVRRIFGQKRAGHLGTLDPGAAGVLPVCIGRAVKLFDYLVDKEKTYLFEVAFGMETDTQDAYGAIVARDDALVSAAALTAVLPQLTGRIAQTAPVYSALKVDGRKMYDLARAGESVEPRVRCVEIPELTLIAQTGVNRFLCRIRCSRGTYVRTVCHDLGRLLGTCAYLSFLLRTASGPFTVERAHSIAELEQRKAQGTLDGSVMGCEEALAFLPRVELPADRRTAAKNALDTRVKGVPDGDVRLYSSGFLGIGEVQNGNVRLKVHLYER